MVAPITKAYFPDLADAGRHAQPLPPVDPMIGGEMSSAVESLTPRRFTAA
jgi:hypothetical protein